MDLNTAIDVIESVAGFTDADTSVGEAWAVVVAQLKPAPAPAGEVGELIEGLKMISDGMDAMGHESDSWFVARAADLLEQRQSVPLPVTVSERLPWSTEPNISGRYICLRGDVYTLYDVDYYRDAQMGISGQWEATEVCKGSRVVCTVASLQPAYWLLVTALPLPSGEAEA